MGNNLQNNRLLDDPRNVDLLALLQNNPRASVSDLARKIGMSAPAVRERIARLEETGIIRGYRVDLNAAALGWPIEIFVRIRPIAGQHRKIADLAASMPEVAECHRITGEDCFIARIYLDALESLDQILDRFLAHGQTTTSLIQSIFVARRPPPLPKARAQPTAGIRVKPQAARGR